MRRSMYCAEVGENNVGQSLTLCGWVQRSRNLGGLIFVWLRDRSGIVQLVFDEDVCGGETFALAEALRSEFVLEITGEVRAREESAINDKLPTGRVEVFVQAAEVLNTSLTPPIYVDDEHEEDELVRLKYRYLDLRRPSMQANFKLRNDITHAAREYLHQGDFIEIETPVLTKSTPEGARDYLVPSRVQPGKFFALPQSPQQFKQILMISGFDKYYQVARCFRDEDLRADRQLDFTQVDIEMSFVEQDDVIAVGEGMLAKIMRDCLGVEIKTPFLRMTWQEAMDQYGSDKPDIRYEMKLHDVSELLVGCGFKVFEGAIEAGGSVRGICLKGGAKMSRKEIDALAKFVADYRAKGLAWAVRGEDGTLKSSFAKFLSEERMNALLEALGAENGDAVFLVADQNDVVWASLGALRQELAKRFNLYDEKEFKFLIVNDFPLLEYDEESGRYVAVHHPFTSVHPEDEALLDTDPGKARALAYDVVLNGFELAGGSIRIHRRDMQRKVFALLGYDEAEQQARFGYLLDAFEYGAPPHGGIAMGLDRAAMLLCHGKSLRDVIAFPKIQSTICPLTGAPDVVAPEQLEELHIALALDE